MEQEPIVQEIKNSKGVSIMRNSDSKPDRKSHISSLKNLLEKDFVSCNSTEKLPVGWFKAQINSADYFYNRKTGKRRWHHPCGCTCDKYFKYPVVKNKPIISTHIGRLKECNNQPKESKKELSQMEKDSKEQKDRIRKLKDLERAAKSKQQTQLFIETPYRNNHVFEDILKNCFESSKLCIAVDITLQTEQITTKTVADWKKTKIDLHKKPCLFLIG